MVSQVLVCFAVPEEARCFTAVPNKGCAVEKIITGMGRRNAEAAVSARLAQAKPSLVLTCGFAGGLKPGLEVGKVLFDAESAELAAALKTAGAQAGTFYCSPRIAVTSGEKAELFKSTGADAVEMESGPIRQLCQKQQIPSATVRVISDAAEEDLPLDFNQLVTDDFQLSYVKLAWAVGSRPWRIPGLMRLQRNTASAARAMSNVLEALLLGNPFGRD